jgi:4a-hydroxytetrahydrobiopterin dehydratase
MARTPLNEQQIAEGLAALDGWRADSTTAISKEYAFKDHIAALGFVVKVAAVAETIDHHPTIEWTYNRVRMVLNTHDAGGVTERDFQLAARIDALA